MSSQRLDKIISSQTSLSRKDAVRKIKDGCLSLNGEIVLSADTKADPEIDEIVFCGERLSYSEHIYIMMNKPKGVVSASTDRRVKTVVDLVPEHLRRASLFPAGRLDKDTTGFVLITDDGEFAHNILSPKKHIFKTYEAKLSSPISDENIKKLENGIILNDGTRLKECFIRVLNDSRTEIEIKICEGKYHQIKRMLFAVDNSVEELKRTALGNLTIDKSLKNGECRLINGEELKLISDFDE